MILFTSNIVRPCSHQYGPLVLIVGLDVALKGPFPLVGESESARESELAPQLSHQIFSRGTSKINTRFSREYRTHDFSSNYRFLFTYEKL
jgi:hypothetical protein